MGEIVLLYILLIKIKNLKEIEVISILFRLVHIRSRVGKTGNSNGLHVQYWSDDVLACGPFLVQSHGSRAIFCQNGYRRCL